MHRSKWLQGYITAAPISSAPSDLLQVPQSNVPHREAWVLEPEKPTPADVSRRIALGGHCSLLLELDPERPRTRPAELRLLGSEAAAAPMRARLRAADAAPWDASM